MFLCKSLWFSYHHNLIFIIVIAFYKVYKNSSIGIHYAGHYLTIMIFIITSHFRGAFNLYVFLAVGEVMRGASSEFADDPCSSVKRGAMVRAARALLSAVTRLLILADMVDVHLLLKSLRIVSSA